MPKAVCFVVVHKSLTRSVILRKIVHDNNNIIK